MTALVLDEMYPPSLDGELSAKGDRVFSSTRYPRTGSGLPRIAAALDELLRTDGVPAPGTVIWLKG